MRSCLRLVRALVLGVDHSHLLPAGMAPLSLFASADLATASTDSSPGVAAPTASAAAEHTTGYGGYVHHQSGYAPASAASTLENANIITVAESTAEPEHVPAVNEAAPFSWATALPPPPPLARAASNVPAAAAASVNADAGNYDHYRGGGGDYRAGGVDVGGSASGGSGSGEMDGEAAAFAAAAGLSVADFAAVRRRLGGVLQAEMARRTLKRLLRRALRQGTAPPIEAPAPVHPQQQRVRQPGPRGQEQDPASATAASTREPQADKPDAALDVAAAARERTNTAVRWLRAVAHPTSGRTLWRGAVADAVVAAYGPLAVARGAVSAPPAQVVEAEAAAEGGVDDGSEWIALWRQSPRLLQLASADAGVSLPADFSWSREDLAFLHGKVCSCSPMCALTGGWSVSARSQGVHVFA